MSGPEARARARARIGTTKRMEQQGKNDKNNNIGAAETKTPLEAITKRKGLLK